MQEPPLCNTPCARSPPRSERSCSAAGTITSPDNSPIDTAITNDTTRATRGAKTFGASSCQGAVLAMLFIPSAAPLLRTRPIKTTAYLR
ncbi:hypothetical protein ACFU9F_18375 [Streptomyces zhihengii]|uniref:hypothetical protein n=1 Tax=Streptomyces zhihengii TaxID=1818004 RepID=UPI0036C1694A